MLLMLNVDDISSELVPQAIDGLMERGAKSVHVVPAITKKGRPEYIFFIDAPRRVLDTLTQFVAVELGTIGVRVFEPEHLSIPYHLVNVQLECPAPGFAGSGLVRVKCMEDKKGELLHVKAEYEDLRAVAALLRRTEFHLSLQSLKSLVEMVAMTGEEGTLGAVTARVASTAPEEPTRLPFPV